MPAIAQDAASGAVLMLAWMNREAFDETLRTGRAVYQDQGGGRARHRLPDQRRPTVIARSHDRIPVTLRDATIAAEDANFYQNPGFDLRAMGAEVVMTRSDVHKGHPEYYQDYAARLATDVFPDLSVELLRRPGASEADGELAVLTLAAIPVGLVMGFVGFADKLRERLARLGPSDVAADRAVADERRRLRPERHVAAVRHPEEHGEDDDQGPGGAAVVDDCVHRRDHDQGQSVLHPHHQAPPDGGAGAGLIRSGAIAVSAGLAAGEGARVPSKATLNFIIQQPIRVSQRIREKKR